MTMAARSRLAEGLRRRITHVGIGYWPLRVKLTAALVLIGVLPTILTLYIGRLPLWMALPPIVVVVLLTTVLARRLMAPIVALERTIARVQAGDLTARAHLPRHDEIGEIGAAFDALTARAQTSIDDLEGQRLELENGIIKLFMELSEAANGDLTVRPTLSEGSLGAVADSVAVLLRRFSAIVHSIQETAREVSGGTQRMATTVQQVSHEAHEQAAALARGATTIDALAASAATVSGRTQSAMVVATHALDAVRDGHNAVRTVHEAMNGFRDTTRRATRTVKSLGESAQLMSQALMLVQRNTEELHIVAGNASIEAARHADSGGIFRAMADSIEALAEQSQLALRQIQDVVERNRGETVGVIEAIEDIAARVTANTDVVRTAAEAFGAVDGVVHDLADLNKFIASASAEQARQAAELVAMMGALNGISVQTSRNTAASAEAAVRLRRLTDRLNDSVATLKVS